MVCIPSSFRERVPLYLILEPVLILTTGKPKVTPAVSEYVLNFLVPGLGATLTPTTVLAHIFLSFIVTFSFMAMGDFPFVLTSWEMHLEENLHHFLENVSKFHCRRFLFCNQHTAPTKSNRVVSTEGPSVIQGLE